MVMSGDMADQEYQVKKVKKYLEGFRIILLPLKSILLWEQQWHPCILIGSISLLYFFIWLMDLNTLTTFAVLGLLINFFDFIVPIVCKSIYSPNLWTGQKEKTFEEICRSIVMQYNITVEYIRNFLSLRDSSPYLYYVVTICTFLALAWLSSAVNNVLLFYVLSTTALLWPGLRHKGLLNMFVPLFNASKSFKSE